MIAKKVIALSVPPINPPLMLTSTPASKKEHFFKEHLLLAASYRETHVLESLFNSEYCEIFKSTYFEERLRTAASENVFMKLWKIKIYS